ncbi:MAG: hypothetical protein EXR45_08485 [Chloroflexi bacterium]|nr:hypothetical protein [Chloroflexota bacterium]
MEPPPGFGEPPDRARWSWRRRITFAMVSLLFVLVPIGIGAGLYRASGDVTNLVFDVLMMTAWVTSPSDRPPEPVGAGTPMPEGTPAPEAPRFEASQLDVPEWSSKERVNIILLGTDRRDNEPDVTRTDTLLIVSIDPVTKSAGVLSLPRDLWVNIPGYGYERINSAFEIGEFQKKGGGPALLRKTIEGLLGVPIHHYALVGFTGFRKVVDQLGGVVVDVERPFRDDEFPSGNFGTRRILFQTGLQVLDGETALWYVRSRHADSDFGRNRRQRQFLLAVRQQALQLNMITKAPAMLSSLMDSVKTDLRTTEILSLARVAKDVETSKLVSRAVDETMVNPWMTPGGAAVLLPEPAAIRQVVQEVFGTPAKLPMLPVMRAPPVVSTPDVLNAPIAINPVSSTPGGPTATPMDLPGSRSASFFVTPSVVPTRMPASVTPVNLLRGPLTVTPVGSGAAVTGMGTGTGTIPMATSSPNAVGTRSVATPAGTVTGPAGTVVRGPALPAGTVVVTVVTSNAGSQSPAGGAVAPPTAVATLPLGPTNVPVVPTRLPTVVPTTVPSTVATPAVPVAPVTVPATPVQAVSVPPTAVPRSPTPTSR